MKEGIFMRKHLFKNEKGSIVVEASMAVPIFMFAILTILSVVNICSAQVLMTNTVNGLTKDIAKFSYIYCKVGIYGIQSEQDKKGADATKAATTVMKSTDVEGLLDNFGKAIEIVEESDNFGESLFHAILGNGINALNELVLSGVAGHTAEKRLTSSYYNADELLQHYGIENGLSDVNFYIWFDTGTDYIYVMADYNVKILDLLGIDKTMHFTKKSKAVVWNPKTSYAELEEETTEATSEASAEPATEASTEEATTEEKTTEATTEATTEDPRQQKYEALIKQYKKEDIDQILDLYGYEALELIYLYGDGAFLAIYYYGGDAVRLIKKYGQGAAHVICANEEHLIEVLKLIDEYGQDAVDAISEYGYESDEQIIKIIRGQ